MTEENGRRVAGLYPLCKPPGLSSHDVVDSVRRLTGERHAGHAGTLDPAAAGVLLVLVGRDPVRLAEYLLDLPKVYVAEIRLGQSTDTQDYTGRVVATAPEEDIRRLEPAELTAALARFHGVLEQVPPMVSALHVDGERLYRLAREGRVVDRKARRIVVYDLKLLSFVAAGQGPSVDPDPRSDDGGCRPSARVRVVCSRGTYVRTMAHDIGRQLGIGAHLGFLVREAVGVFDLAATLTLEELAEAARTGRLADVRVPPAQAVGHLPAVRLQAGDCERVRHGEAVAHVEGAAAAGFDGQVSAVLTASPLELDPVRVLSEEGDLVAMGSLQAGRVRPRKVFGSGKLRIGGGTT